ncbi:MAG: YbjN domain-containing protein [Chloroflexi bacterium]|nr:YbjN domain-containing protein [Chloroflexota bacterium]MBU1749843.1 YbjN domain-containing protein [Chloroflexota bacterium]MBU1877319.1 YbjN domain-containing protein [Chloroflexota bacterium]
MTVTPETIDSYFEQYGWKYKRDEDGDWITGFRGDVQSFRFFVRLTEHWVYFTISPYIVAPKDPVCQQRLHTHLMRLNRDINMAKFCLDNDMDVVLTVELPREGFDYSEFADAIGALSHYADNHYVEVVNLAQSPTAASQYLVEATHEDDLDWGES